MQTALLTEILSESDRTMPSSHGTLLVIGSGPGIGVHVAKIFAERGFKKVILASRDEERLAKEVEDVKSAGGGDGVEVVATTIDLASKENVDAALGEVEKYLGNGKLEAVLFNAARIGPSKLFEFTGEEVERDLQVCLRLSSSSTSARWSVAC